MSSSYTLVQLFDEDVKYSSVLSSSTEADFLRICHLFEESYKRLNSSNKECDDLKAQLRRAKSESEERARKLDYMTKQYDHEIKMRSKAEATRDNYRRQILLVKELLLENGSHLSDKDKQSLALLHDDLGGVADSPAGFSARPAPRIEESRESIISDISYDKTEDDIDNQSSDNIYNNDVVTGMSPSHKPKRPSAPPLEDLPPAKIRRASDDNLETSYNVVTKTTVTLPPPHDNGPVHAVARVESVTTMPSTPDTRQQKNAPLEPLLTPKERNAKHTFCSKTIIKPETCNPCGKKVRFGKLGLKCKDCRIVSHPECRDLITMPCIPVMPHTPGNDKLETLAQYAPKEPPRIPSILIHLIRNVEERGMSEVGIYRVPGSERQIKDLVEVFVRGKVTPNLNAVDDVHVVCGAVKMFLRRLKEPVITYALHRRFIEASEHGDREDALSAIYQCVSELPETNRETLAYLMRHLQRVAEIKENKMPATNLARVFGMTLIGHTAPDPDPYEVLQYTKKQIALVEQLLAVPQDFWQQIANYDVLDTRNPIPARPILGYLTTPRSTYHTPSSTISSRVRSRNQFTPGFTPSPTSSRRTGQLYSSPTLK